MSKTYLGNWNELPVYLDKTGNEEQSTDNRTVEHCVFHEISDNSTSENNQSEVDLKNSII